MTQDRGDLVSLGAFIRQRRMELALTQTQLGRRIGYYQERISALERGSYGMPSLNGLQELAQALECELTDLLYASGFLVAPVQETGDPIDPTDLYARAYLLADGMDGLQQRLSQTENIVQEMGQLRERIRANRRAMDQRLQAARSAVPEASS
jgi:transcriptional regulator with XRE-family HTH domain